MVNGTPRDLGRHNGSHDMRHTVIPQVDGGQRDLGIWGVTIDYHPGFSSFFFTIVSN